MSGWMATLLKQDATILDAIQKIDASSLQIALVVDDQNKLLGTITDGDIRRCILKGMPLSGPARQIMNPSPVTSRVGGGRESALASMQRKRIHQIPIVDEHGRVVGLETLDEYIRPRLRPNRVVLMAGGPGSRLYPLTADCPKPMLKVGNKPLLEIILENFIEYGFHQFYVSVNYMAEVVKTHFGDGSAWGADIRYLQEDQKLGTAGGLSLLPERPAESLLVMNGDLLTKVNFAQLLDFHKSHHAEATMCVREYDFQVPYGVVRIDDQRLVAIDEKPKQHFFVNAGIYVLEPDALSLIPANSYFDMPSLFEKLIAKKRSTAVFPIREYWLDIGQVADYDRAKVDFGQNFS